MSITRTPGQIARARYTTKAYDPARPLTATQVEELLDVLYLSPSSINSQPWHFLIAADAQARARVAEGTQGAYAYNAPKVRGASLVLVLAARREMTDDHIAAVLDQEQADGRFASEEARAQRAQSCAGFVELHRSQLHDARHWMEKQVYLALGGLLFAAGAMGIDATPMEGFDPAVLDNALGLPAQGLGSVVLVALGHRGAGDFNATLPKSRLPRGQVFTWL
ncbi:oxygen-insensitive NAD(P)H nitroreductase [Stenotrophomonas sp. HITSZ_GD]|uniref:oxygen-insensitive NAD(P)H nitroreductase n=1 Tax=Stenotrophomonas sp. HITSZ_GD TaxID=3037248 RepID=UPI00240E65F0|nr:oxygen-insensitive NAD(P)H nitroreductase [Stenotrophomonas sp. HITSZ_GD]MDG2524087.1 oxygen-insensitive NAD(P)H nitroreductase [Stenotrophomonas sp. HITSZ_GD]